MILSWFHSDFAEKIVNSRLIRETNSEFANTRVRAKINGEADSVFTVIK